MSAKILKVEIENSLCQGTEGAIVILSYKHSPNLPLNVNDKILGLITKIKYLHNEFEIA